MDSLERRLTRQQVKSQVAASCAVCTEDKIVDAKAADAFRKHAKVLRSSSVTVACQSLCVCQGSFPFCMDAAAAYLEELAEGGRARKSPVSVARHLLLPFAFYTHFFCSKVYNYFWAGRGWPLARLWAVAFQRPLAHT